MKYPFFAFLQRRKTVKIGVWEMVVVVIVALFVIGPDKLPYYAKKIGLALKEFRKVSEEMAKEVRESVAEEEKKETEEKEETTELP